MSSHLDPLVRARPDGLQLSYQLPHRVYDATVYPIKSPNDSTIIIYSHDLGISVLWRGGRRFKPQPPPAPPAAAPTKPNGARDDDVIMIISDSEDEAPPEPSKEPPMTALFEEEEDEIDPSRPFPDVLRTIHIPLGAKVLSLAIPNIRTSLSLDSCPPVLSSTMVIAAACADSSTRVIMLPLLPPAEDGKPDIQTLTIASASVHIPASVAITVSSMSHLAKTSQSQSQSRGRPSSPIKKIDSWDLLLAVHSPEAVGTLSIYRIPVSRGPQNIYSLPRDSPVPFRQQLLPAPANRLSFSPSQFPSDRHSELLVSFPSGYVKVYSCLAAKSRKPGSDRRQSTVGAGADFEGRWLLTLHAGFDPASSSGRRKTVVDAKWVVGGRGIMILQSDGEWGVWDLEGTGPSTLAESTTTPPTAPRSLSSFAVTGRVSAPDATRSQQYPAPSAADEFKSKFAPMTPSTRRVREEVLFKGAPTSGPAHAVTTRGGIAVKRANASSSWDQTWDESILIWHGDKIVQLPSLLSVWRHNIRTSATFDHPSRSKPALIEGVSFYGQNQNGISYLPDFSKTGQRQGFGGDVLLVAEYHLVILSMQKTDGEQEQAARVDSRKSAAAEDQARLRRGELDLDGMGRMLASMSNGNRPGTSRGRSLFS